MTAAPPSPATSQHPPPPGPLTRLVRNQRVAYLLVGGINTLVGLGIFVVVHELFGDRVGYMGSLVISYAFAIVIAFTMHRRFVFKVTGHLLRDFARFASVHISSLAINAVLLPLLVEAVGLPPIVAQTAATGLTVVISFFAHKYFSFQRDLAPGNPGDLIER
jgi:putative flippase GtrA